MTPKPPRLPRHIKRGLLFGAMSYTRLPNMAYLYAACWSPSDLEAIAADMRWRAKKVK